MSTRIDPLLCPLCGGENHCQTAQGHSSCWCFSRAIPDDVLARIPEGALDRSCICERCAFGQLNSDSAHRQMQEILKRRRGG